MEKMTLAFNTLKQSAGALAMAICSPDATPSDVEFLYMLALTARAEMEDATAGAIAENPYLAKYARLES